MGIVLLPLIVIFGYAIPKIIIYFTSSKFQNIWNFYAIFVTLYSLVNIFLIYFFQDSESFVFLIVMSSFPVGFFYILFSWFMSKASVIKKEK